MQINCLIVDDDPITMMEVEKMVRKTPFLKLVATADNAIDGFNLISSGKADIVFLDIMMPGVTGLELISSLESNKPEVIIMTTEGKYAAEAFNYDVTDFLTKPISEERFLKAAEKAKRNYTTNKVGVTDSNQLFIKVKSQLLKINTGDILYIRSKGAHSTVHTRTGNFEVNKTLKELEEKLVEKHFMRVHTSYIVNLHKITSIEGTSLIVHDAIVPVSQGHVNQLKTLLHIEA